MFFLNKLCLTLVFCLHFIEYTLAFVPTSAVWGHSAALIDSKIYFTGGIYAKIPNDFGAVEFSKEFFYLDLNTPFKVGEGSSLPWTDLSFVSQILPKHSWSAFSNCGNDTLVLYIGESPVNLVSLAYTYEIKSQLWNNPLTTNQPNNTVHSQSQTVCDDKTGKMYRFGGSSPTSPPVPTSNMDILGTWTRVWEVGSTINAPEGKYDHTGTLLPSGYIIYIGGNSASGLVDMSKLPLYNINDSTWSIMNVPGYSPTPRGYHSAVLTKDGRIIVYGGYSGSNPVTPVSDDLVVLDTTTQPTFTWSRANSANPPLSRFYHTATLVDDYMIVAFGRNNINLPPPGSNEIFILYTGDKSNYKWVDEFPISTPSCEINNNHNQRINRNLIIGIVILSSVLVLIGVLFLIYLYRKRRQSQPDILISGNR